MQLCRVGENQSVFVHRCYGYRPDSVFPKPVGNVRGVEFRTDGSFKGFVEAQYER